MIDRLRKDLDKVGNYNPGMADGGVVPHDDEAQDAQMIEQVLQKVIDQMHSMEAGRIHPKVVDAKVTAVVPKPNEQESMEGQEEPQDENGLNPDVLKTLLDKAGSADESGATPDDMSDLHPGLADIVRNKKKMV